MNFNCINNKIKSLLLLFFLAITLSLQGQNSNLLNINSLTGSGNLNISSLVDKQVQYIKDSYSSKVEAPKEIINGKEYESYYRQSKSKPLLFPEKQRTATLFTKTRQFNNLTLQYDTYLDDVIYTDTQRTLNYRYPQIALNKDIVEGFNLYFEDDSLIFRYFGTPECNNNNLKEGFYEVAYQGKCKFIIKHKSSLYERDGLNEYKYFHEYYISSGNTFYKITNRKSFLNLFGERSGEIKKHLHASRTKIRHAEKGQLISVLKFYDSLFTSSR
jgi:hypothetical protein